MRILVIGEPCIDVIHKADGKVYHEIGGISYSIVASAILNDGIETVPVIGLSREDRGYFADLFEKLDSVNLSAVYETGSPVRRVDLFYEDENRRWECSTRSIEPTPLEEIEKSLPADGIHVNLISGSDITLETLGRLRTAAAGCHIHLDLHNLVMQHMPDGKRVRGPREDYLSWCDCADTVQINEEEANAIDPEIGGFKVLAEKILRTNAKALIISFAENGLSLYEKDGGRISERFYPTRSVDVVDPTGSGDVFGISFLHSVLLGKTFSEAAESGVEMAAKKVSVAGPSGLLKYAGRSLNV